MGRKIIILVTMTIFLIVGYLGISIWSFAKVDQLGKTDAAIVLGAAAWGDEPSPVLRERINHSIWLYQNGYVDKLIFTGGRTEGSPFAESEVAKMYAIKKNVNPSDIYIETKSTITEENLKYAYDIAQMNNIQSFTIVSDPLHMKRAIIMANDLGMEAYSSPTTSTVYKSLHSKFPFFVRELFFLVGYLIVSPFR
jgi:uncharacterized SAM-binding protein YcdF (DUF218 family)